MLYTEKAVPGDIAAVMPVVEAARTIMWQSGNVNQWDDKYPSEAVIMDDISGGEAFVVKDATGRIVGYFAFRAGPDPTYRTIYQGKWIDECPYYVIHRVAGLPHVHGIFAEVMRFCFSFGYNIRIDTHRDNHIMQHLLAKYGFTYCGVIRKANGDERLAYQK